MIHGSIEVFTDSGEMYHILTINFGFRVTFWQDGSRSGLAFCTPPLSSVGGGVGVLGKVHTNVMHHAGLEEGVVKRNLIAFFLSTDAMYFTLEWLIDMTEH